MSDDIKALNRLRARLRGAVVQNVFLAVLLVFSMYMCAVTRGYNP